MYFILALQGSFGLQAFSLIALFNPHSLFNRSQTPVHLYLVKQSL